MNMVELIERLEKATGPDRELDVSIALALGIVKEREGNMLYGAKDFTVLVLESDYYDNGGNPPELWHYTSSIDSALTLLGGEWFWRLGNDGEGQDPGSYRADILAGFKKFVGHGNTPAIALCIAALKARTALSEPEGTKE